MLGKIQPFCCTYLGHCSAQSTQVTVHIADKPYCRSRSYCPAYSQYCLLLFLPPSEISAATSYNEKGHLRSPPFRAFCQTLLKNILFAANCSQLEIYVLDSFHKRPVHGPTRAGVFKGWLSKFDEISCL